MHILHIVRQFDPSKGGLETYVRDLAIEQYKMGHRVTILTLDRVFGTNQALRAEQIFPEYTVKRISFLGGRQCFLPFLKPSLLKNYDIVHCHGTDQMLDITALYSVFSQRLHKRLFFTTHGLFFHTDSLLWIKKIYLRTITKFSLSRMQGVFSCSQNDADILSEADIASKIIYNPIKPFENLRANGNDFIYLGRISKNKNVHLLIDFYSTLLKEKEDIGLLHIIGGDNENLLPDLEEKVKKLKLTDRIIFHGFASQEKLEELIKQGKYIISASRYEGYGMAMVEGMSAGLIPVMQENPAFCEIKQRAELGFVGNFYDITEIIRDFLAWEQTVDNESSDKAIAFAQTQTIDALRDRLEEEYSIIKKYEKPKDISHKKNYICGIGVDFYTNNQALERIKKALEEKNERLSIAFANTNLCVKLHKHPKRHELLKEFNMILCDGVGLDIASSMVNKEKFPANLNGTDFTPKILKNIKVGTKIALFGSKMPTLEKTKFILENDYGMKVVFLEHGFQEITDDLIKRLKSSDADILLVAQGNPLQEETILKFSESGVKIPVMIGVGALFEFMTGSISRAPEWVRSLRIEWFYRLYKEPKRLIKRYTVDVAKFFYLVFSYKNNI